MEEAAPVSMDNWGSQKAGSTGGPEPHPRFCWAGLKGLSANTLGRVFSLGRGTHACVHFGGDRIRPTEGKASQHLCAEGPSQASSQDAHLVLVAHLWKVFFCKWETSPFSKGPGVWLAAHRAELETHRRPGV